MELDTIENIENYLLSKNINVIVNCAAYTNVDKAEEMEEYDKVNNINVVGVRNLAEVCDERDLFLIQISTDFVFDGDSNKPYNEEDVCNPINAYGRSKYYGENEVYWCDNHMIIRTAWLYSEFGKNFFKTMLNRINDGLETKVVSDQIGTPTYARDLARFIIHVLEYDNPYNHIGTYHFTNFPLSAKRYPTAAAFLYSLSIIFTSYGSRKRRSYSCFNSSLNFGCAIEIILSTLSLIVVPFKFTQPYSVTK